MEKKLTIEDLKKISKETKNLNIKPMSVKISEEALKYDRIKIAKRNSEKVFKRIFF